MIAVPLKIIFALGCMLFGFRIIYIIQEKKYSNTEIPVAWAELFLNAEQTSPQKKLWKWWLYSLQCFTLLLLLMLLFHIKWFGAQERVIFILDRTHSMLAKNESQKINKFVAAQQIINNKLNEFSNPFVDLYTFGGTANHSQYPDKLSASNAINALKPANMTGDLVDAINLLKGDIERYEANRIFVLTDHLSDNHKQLLKNINVPVEVNIISGSSKNLYIRYLKIISGFIDLNPENIIISYQFGNASGSNEFFYRIIVKEIKTGKEYIWKPENKIVLGSEQREAIVMTAAELADKIGLKKITVPASIHIEILPDKSDDYLSEDNHAWEIIPELTPIQLGVFDKKISEFLKQELEFDTDKTGDSELYEQIRKIQIIDMSEKNQLQTNVNKTIPYHDISILNHTPPRKGETMPHIACFYILAHPPKENIKFPKDNELQEIKEIFMNEDTLGYSYCEIISWKRNDSLTKYLDNLSINSLKTTIYPYSWFVIFMKSSAYAKKQYSPGWLQNIISGRRPVKDWTLRNLQIPIVMKGEFDNKYAVVFNFDITEYDMQIYKDLKILLLNSIVWLYSQTRMPNAIIPGDPIRIPWDPSHGPFWITDAFGNEKRCEKNNIPMLDFCGVYQLSDSNKNLVHSIAVRPPEIDSEYSLKTASANQVWTNDIFHHSSNNVSYAKNNFWNTSFYPKILLWIAVLILIIEFLLYLFFYNKRVTSILNT